MDLNDNSAARSRRGGRRADFYRRVPREMTEVRRRMPLPSEGCDAVICGTNAPATGPRRHPPCPDARASLSPHAKKTAPQATKVGIAMSLLSVLLMVALFFSETWSFAHPTLRSSLEIDPEGEEMLELHFNVTLFDVHCDLVSVGESLRPHRTASLAPMPNACGVPVRRDRNQTCGTPWERTRSTSRKTSPGGTWTSRARGGNFTATTPSRSP